MDLLYPQLMQTRQISLRQLISNLFGITPPVLNVCILERHIRADLIE